MQDSHRSLPFVISNVLRAIPGMLDDPDFIEITELLEAECEKLEKVDHREQNMFLLMLFCTKRYLILFKSENGFASILTSTELLRELE